MKRKLQIFTTYGKMDNKELREEIMVSSQKELDDILEDDWANELIGLFDFDNQENQSENVDNDGGDWDDPTGHTYVLISKSSEKEGLESELERIQNQIDNLDNVYGVE